MFVWFDVVTKHWAVLKDGLGHTVAKGLFADSLVWLCITLIYLEGNTVTVNIRNIYIRKCL